MIDIFYELDYVKKWSVDEGMKSSVLWYDISTETNENVVIMSNLDIHNKNSYVTLITDEFTLRYDGKGLTLTSIVSDNVYDALDDPNISEEWFFQMSTVKNYGTLQYEEIQFVKELFNRRYTMGI